MTVAAPRYADLRWNPDDNRWEAAKAIIGSTRVTLGPTASQQWLDAPDHLAMVLSRYRAAAALIGTAKSVLEVGCGEGIGAGVLAKDLEVYVGIDTDAEAIADANTCLLSRSRTDRRRMSFVVADMLDLGQRSRPVSVTRQDALFLYVPLDGGYDAVVSLDVIEHIPVEHEGALLSAITDALTRDGVCVIGTPNAAFDHLASPQSRAGHCNTYTHERLHALMAKHFRVVQSFGLNDVALHLGHPDARHYLLMAGIGPR